MMLNVKRAVSVTVRLGLFVAIFAGPLCAMTLQQERGLGEGASSAGLVLVTSLQRG